MSGSGAEEESTRTRPRQLVIIMIVLASGMSTVAHGSIPEGSQEKWVARHGPSGQRPPPSLALSPDGTRIFVTGVVTAAYDAASGIQVWVANLGGSAIAVSSDGTKVFVTGTIYHAAHSFSADYQTAAYDSANGSLLWVDSYDGPANSGDMASSIDVSPDGTKLYVTGSSFSLDPEGPSLFSTVATIAYSATTGSRLWVSRYNDSTGTDAWASSLAVGPDGSRVYVTGQSGEFESGDYVTMALDSSDGSTLWTASYDGPGNKRDSAFALAVSNDGSKVFVVGDSAGSDTIDYATIAYESANGLQLWVARNEQSLSSHEYRGDLAISPDDSAIYLTGPIFLSTATLSINDPLLPFYAWAAVGRTGYQTVAYDASSGSQRWVSHFETPTGNGAGATSIALSPNGSTAYVTGFIRDFGGTWDFMTVAYVASSGSLLWAARYDSPGNVDDVASSVAVSPDGSTIYVTGWSGALSADGLGYANFQNVTVAYRSTSCSSGVNEDGPVTSQIHDILEHQGGPSAPYLHGANCDIVAPLGL